MFRVLNIIMTCSVCVGALSSLTPWTNQFTKEIFLLGGIIAMMLGTYIIIRNYGLSKVLIAIGLIAAAINAVKEPTLNHILIAGGFTFIVVLTGLVTCWSNKKRNQLIDEGIIPE